MKIRTIPPVICNSFKSSRGRILAPIAAASTNANVAIQLATRTEKTFCFTVPPNVAAKKSAVGPAINKSPIRGAFFSVKKPLAANMEIWPVIAGKLKTCASCFVFCESIIYSLMLDALLYLIEDYSIYKQKIYK